MWCYVTEDRARAESILAGVLVPMLNRPADELRAKLPIGPAEECAAKLLAYARGGAQRVFLWPLADERAQLEVFRERVMPLLDGWREVVMAPCIRGVKLDDFFASTCSTITS